MHRNEVYDTQNMDKILWDDTEKMFKVAVGAAFGVSEDFEFSFHSFPQFEFLP